MSPHGATRGEPALSASVDSPPHSAATVACGHGAPRARAHRNERQPPLPRGDDVRRLGDTDHDECIRIIHRALDAGINFIDTADVYSRGESEEIVGKALAGGRRDDVVLATKVHGTMGDDPNEAGDSRRWIVREVESSLRRLGTDWIDLYQIHRPRPDTDIDETLGALTTSCAPGKIRYIGSSTFPASQIVEAQWVAERRVRERFVCEQPPYSIMVRGSSRTCSDLSSATAWASSPGAPSPAAGCPASGARAPTT